MTSQDKEEMWLLEEGFGGEKSAAFFAARQRLQAGEPLGYLIGSIPFLDCTIQLDSKPLIPRTETEFWTELAIKEIKMTKLKSPHILDLCSGSGCIGVAVAKAISSAYVDFSEIENAHIITIEKNIQLNCGTKKHCHTIVSNLFENITSRYDFILSNPPYIDTNLDRTEASVAGFEPHLALYGGRGGLDLINKIISVAPSHLNPTGQLWIEHEPEQSSSIKTVAEQAGFISITKKDQYGQERYSILVLQ